MSPQIPKGIRLNNPGNLRRSATPWVGKIVPPRDPDFESFDTLENGVRALARNLLTHWRRGERSVRALITAYAPDSENDTESYIEFVAGRLGVAPDAMVDLADLRVLERGVDAVIAMECKRYPIPVEILRAGCARALGLALPSPAPSATA